MIVLTNLELQFLLCKLSMMDGTKNYKTCAHTIHYAKCGGDDYRKLYK